MKYWITGSPVVLKNSKRIVKMGKFTRLIPSAKVLKAEKIALIELNKQKGSIWRGELHVVFKFYGAWKRGNKNVPDLSNLFEAPQDWLQKVGIIEDDRQIESLDGSRRYKMCDTCADRKKFVKGPRAGEYKADCGAVKRCPYERTEITIKRYEPTPFD